MTEAPAAAGDAPNLLPDPVTGEMVSKRYVAKKGP